VHCYAYRQLADIRGLLADLLVKRVHSRVKIISRKITLKRQRRGRSRECQTVTGRFSTTRSVHTSRLSRWTLARRHSLVTSPSSSYFERILSIAGSRRSCLCLVAAWQSHGDRSAPGDYTVHYYSGEDQSVFQSLCAES